MRPTRLAIWAAVALLSSACSNSSPIVEDEPANLDALVDTSTDIIASEGSVDDEEVKGGETYPEYDARRDDLNGSAGSYGGYGCTEDCSGHEAGAAWAEEKGITDPDDCGGKSWSFEEGCREYAGGQQDEELEETEEEL